MSDFYDEDRETFHNVNSDGTLKKDRKAKLVSSSQAVDIAKVFLYVFIAILITAVSAFGVGATLFYSANGNVDVLAQNVAITAIVSGIVLLIDMIVINLVSLRGKSSILVPGIIYAITVGVLFSGLTIFVDWRILGMAFGITALMFLLMSLIGFLSKGNLSPLLIVAIGLILGAGIIALFNWMFVLFSGINGLTATLSWVVSFAIFGFIMLVTIFDLWRLKKIAEAGALQGNVALYCAFNIYVDFINVFIRVLFFLLVIYGKRK